MEWEVRGQRYGKTESPRKNTALFTENNHWQPLLISLFREDELTTFVPFHDGGWTFQLQFVGIRIQKNRVALTRQLIAFVGQPHLGIGLSKTAAGH